MNKDNLRQHYHNSKGKEVNIDYFLYSCLSEEKNLEAMPLQKDSLWSEQDSDLTSINDIVLELFTWYQVQHPILTEKTVLDYERVGQVAHLFVKMRLDLEAALKKHKIAITDWETVKRCVQAKFPSYQTHIFKYFKWESKKTDSLDIQSLPPEGRYIGVLKEASAKRNEGRPRSSGSSHSRNNSRNGNSHAGNNSQGNSHDRHKRNDRDRSQNRNPRDRDNRENRDNRFNKNAKSHHRGDKPQVDKQTEQRVLKEAEDAIKQLKTDSAAKDIQLKPQNSYLRHLQHARIKELGFDSTSTGQGPQRAVAVRKP